MKRLLSSTCVLAIIGLVACSNSGNSATLPSTLPTTVPSSIAATVDQGVCDIRNQLLSIVTQIQATSPLPPADLVAQLQDLQSQLQEKAGTLDSQGATPLADQVRALAGAVGQLATAVGGTDPTTLVSAAAAVAGALGQIPGCPSPSPTGSP
jgi:hypothetical protein